MAYVSAIMRKSQGGGMQQVCRKPNHFRRKLALIGVQQGDDRLGIGNLRVHVLSLPPRTNKPSPLSSPRHRDTSSQGNHCQISLSFDHRRRLTVATTGYGINKAKKETCSIGLLILGFCYSLFINLGNESY